MELGRNSEEVGGSILSLALLDYPSYSTAVLEFPLV